MSDSPEATIGTTLARILRAKSGVILVIGAKPSNFPPTLRFQPQIVWWDSIDDYSRLPTVPSNTRFVLFLRFTRHFITGQVMDWCRKHQVPFRWSSTGEVRTILQECFARPILELEATAPPADVPLEPEPPLEIPAAIPQPVQPPVPPVQAEPLPETDVMVYDLTHPPKPVPNPLRHWLLQQTWDPTICGKEARRLKSAVKAIGYFRSLDGLTSAMYQMAIRYRWIPYEPKANTKARLYQEPGRLPLPGDKYWATHSPYGGGGDRKTPKPRAIVKKKADKTPALDGDLADIVTTLKDAIAGIELAVSSLVQYENKRHAKLKELLGSL